MLIVVSFTSMRRISRAAIALLLLPILVALFMAARVSMPGFSIEEPESEDGEPELELDVGGRMAASW